MRQSSISRSTAQSPFCHFLRPFWTLLVCGGLATPAIGQDWEWNGLINYSWSNGSNWSPFGPPPNDAHVYIGSIPSVENSFVNLDMFQTIAALDITDGMSLQTGTHRLIVSGDTLISGSNLVETEFGPVRYDSRLYCGRADGLSFSTHNLTLEDGGEMTLDYSYTRIYGALNIGADSAVRGNGYIGLFGTGATLVNNGYIQAMPNDAPNLWLQQANGGLYDLDGTTGAGRIGLATYSNITESGSKLRIDGTGLTDSFSSRISLASDSDLFMNLSNGWTADASSLIQVFAFPDLDKSSVIRGGAFTFAGQMDVSGVSTNHFRVESDTFSLAPEARVDIGQHALVDFGAAAGTNVHVDGGTYTIAEDAKLRFNGPTLVHGGAFTTADATGSGGRVEFAGPTTWAGNATFDGFVQQNGNATVSAISSINADRFDMDGSSGSTAWNVNNNLVVNAGELQSDGSDFVGGTLNIAGGFLSRLTMNVSDGSWNSNADINLTGDNNLFITRLAGSNLLYSGDLSLQNGKAQISADTVLLGSSSLHLGSSSAALRMTGGTTIVGGSTISGDGMLLNAVSGEMVLRDKVDFNSVGLHNDGVLHIGEDAIQGLMIGAVSVDRFTSAAEALLNISIGGYAAGAEHDLMLISGGSAAIDGLLNVDLVDLGSGVFRPHVGDEFTILTALDEVSGSFRDDPITQLGGSTYEWEVLYQSNAVVLRLENVVPTPGSAALLGLGGLLVGRRRRRA